MSDDSLVVISCAGLHPLVFPWIARVVRTLYLVGSANILAIINLDSFTGLKEVTEDLVENNNCFGVSSPNPNPGSTLGPPYNTYPDLVAEGRTECVLVVKVSPPCLWDSKIGPIDGHQAVVAYVTYFLILEVDLRQG